MRLSESSMATLLPAEVARPAYDRTAQAVGIVDFGIGAFHRAHMAWYTDSAMGAGDRDWAITGVSLRSPDVAQQLNPQDGLYTLTERSAAGEGTRLIGAVRGVLVASQQAEAVIAALAAPPPARWILRWPGRVRSTVSSPRGCAYPKSGPWGIGLIGFAGALAIYFVLPQLGKIYDTAKLEKAGGEDAFKALAAGSPELQSALAYAAEVSFQAVAIIPVILFFIFGAVWLFERRGKTSDEVVPAE